MITEVEPNRVALARRSRDVASERLYTNSRIFAYTRWNFIPVAAALLHCAYFFGMFYLFPRVPWRVMLILGFIYFGLHLLGKHFLEHQRHLAQLPNHRVLVAQ